MKKRDRIWKLSENVSFFKKKKEIQSFQWHISCYRAKMQYGGGVNVIANPSGASGPTEHRAGVQAHPPHVVPVEKTSLETMSVTVAEAPPVTELVTESPLENGLSASNIGVIGGNKIHFSPLPLLSLFPFYA